MPPTTVHESVLLWLRDDPSQLRTLLDLTGHAPCPSLLEVEDSALRKTLAVDVTPDPVLCSPASHAVRRWVIVEVQRQRDAAKARRRPLTMAIMGDRFGPDGELIVVTTSASVARWARRVASHKRGGTRWGVQPTVLLLGHAEAEAILSKGPPEMAVFAAWVTQGRKGARAVDLARRALARSDAVEDERLRRATQEGILAVLHPSVMEQLRRAAMIDINQLPKNPALEKWKAELRAEGAVEGEARGRVLGEAHLLLRILQRRGFAVSVDVEARLLAATDAARIERWADRALDAATLDAVFADD